MTLVKSSKATYTAVSPDITAPCGLSTLSPPLSLSKATVGGGSGGARGLG